jgi:all-trans-8'-apo-beta-carotenal 15,15'-oxygenase
VPFGTPVETPSGTFQRALSPDMLACIHANPRKASIMVNRRKAIAFLGTSIPMLTLEAAAHGRAEPPLLPPSQQWLGRLAESLPAPIDSVPAVEGRLPAGLSGVLYRNGPGLFERNGYRKSTLLDGDGLIRAFTLADGQARFRARFVETRKFDREAQAGRFLFPTWTTPAPGLFGNLPEIPSESQAGVTTVVKSGVLYAFDEVGMPYAMSPETLAAAQPLDPRGPSAEGSPRSYKAHTKTDARTGAWVLAGTSGQPHQQLHAVLVDAGGTPLAQARTPNPRGDYFHDFFWTGRHVVFHLHPAPLSPLPMLLGLRTFADSLTWHPELGSLLVVVDPTGARPAETFEVPATWMWHAVNAYEQDGTIVADFIGYDAPDHFFGPDAALRAIMTGHAGVAASPGRLRRITIDLPRRAARLETLLDEHLEFPITNPRVQGGAYRYAYCAIGDIGRSWFHDGVAKIDVLSGKFEAHRFDAAAYVGEPMFAPRPGSTDEDAGWLLCEVLDGGSERSHLAIFDAKQVSRGPVASVKLTHSLPFSFHGWWQAA